LLPVSEGNKQIAGGAFFGSFLLQKRNEQTTSTTKVQRSINANLQTTKSPRHKEHHHKPAPDQSHKNTDALFPFSEWVAGGA